MIIVVIILLVSLALGVYFAFIKSPGHAFIAPAAQASQTQATGRQQIQEPA
jgi:flagellar basal body-associated protein FliL